MQSNLAKFKAWYDYERGIQPPDAELRFGHNEWQHNTSISSSSAYRPKQKSSPLAAFKDI